MERTCAGGCGSVLSRYNREDVCALCRRRAFDAELVNTAAYTPLAPTMSDAFWFMPESGPGCPPHGTTVPWDRARLSVHSKGWRGTCSYLRCAEAATSCWYSARPWPEGKWRGFCAGHLPMDAAAFEALVQALAVAAVEGEAVLADRLAARPRCDRCGDPVDYSRSVYLMGSPVRLLHRLCVLYELGVVVPMAVAEEFALADGLSVDAAA